jgi:uncharacterized protein YbjT (DUF2867 family)
MRVILFGATGMVGQGALRECLLDPKITDILAIGRSPLGRREEKLREIVRQRLEDITDIEEELRGYDACFFCLGVTSAGSKQEEYRRLTYGLTVGVAQTLAKVNPEMTFIYVSGAGADSSERGRVMWARVRGETENALLRLRFKAYIFRPGFIQPFHGIQSKTNWYRVLYAMMAPLYPALRRLAPKYVTTTEDLGRAMILVAEHGAPKRVLEMADINDCVGLDARARKPA